MRDRYELLTGEKWCDDYKMPTDAYLCWLEGEAKSAEEFVVKSMTQIVWADRRISELSLEGKLLSLEHKGEWKEFQVLAKSSALILDRISEPIYMEAKENEEAAV